VPGAQIGPYKIEAVLGQGGMGQVFRVRDTRLGRIVAIKLIRSEHAEKGDFRHRFKREARAISALNNPYICSLHDIGEQDGSPYLVMEYVEGETLAAMLKAGPLPLDLALTYGSQIAEALAAAHAQGIIHRDLKPGNIMITASGVKVLDFGLAKRADPVSSDLTTDQSISEETHEGHVIGTVAYMSPEQAEGKSIDARSDIFSLGVVLYEMFCGQRPFRGDTTLSTLAAILRGTPDSLRKIRHDIPADIETFVLRCLSKNPADRYATATEMCTAIAACRGAHRGSPVGLPVLAQQSNTYGRNRNGSGDRASDRHPASRGGHPPSSAGGRQRAIGARSGCASETACRISNQDRHDASRSEDLFSRLWG
jgi:serine/threonine protein kinase